MNQLPQSIKIECPWWMFTQSFYMYLIADKNGERYYENGSTRLFNDGDGSWLIEFDAILIRFIWPERLDDPLLPFGDYRCGIRVTKDDRNFVSADDRKIHAPPCNKTINE